MNREGSGVIVAVGLALCCVAAIQGVPASQDAAPSKDKVEILIIEPAGPVPRGVEVEFTFDIQYTLESIEEGVLTVGFNMGDPSSNPNAFRLVESRAITHGTDRITVKAKAIPVDWGERGAFRVAVNIGPKREDMTWKPLAFTIKEIPTAP